MIRARALLFSVALIAAIGASAQAQTQLQTQIQSPTKVASVTLAPIVNLKTIRTPETLQLQTLPLTNRVISKAAIDAFLQTRVTPVAPAGPPSKMALVVILENGGLMKNVDPSLRQALNVNIRTASCGDFEIELKAGESIPDMLGRLGTQFLGNVACVNPANWRVTAFNPLTWLNQMTDTALENAVKADHSLLNTQTYYDKVVVLEDEDAVPAKAIAVIRQLAPSYTIDVHVLTHGSNELFIGFNNAQFTNSNFFSKLQVDKDAGTLFLRSVYQMNCVSGTLKDNWERLGAVCVNGTEALNLNNMPHQYFHFLERWLTDHQAMNTSSQGSFEDAAAYTRPVYALIGRGNQVDTSRLTTAGTNQGVKVTSAL